MYYVYFSNGFRTLIQWDGFTAFDVDLCFEILSTHYPSTVNVTIVRIVKVGL